MANVKYPSSIGLTFAVDTHATSDIRVRISAARYELVSSHGDKARESRRRRRGPGSTLRRSPIEVPPKEISVGHPHKNQIELTPGLGLYWRVRQTDKVGIA